MNAPCGLGNEIWKIYKWRSDGVDLSTRLGAGFERIDREA